MMWNKMIRAVIPTIALMLLLPISCSHDDSPVSPQGNTAATMWQKVFSGEMPQYAVAVATVPGDGYVAVGGVMSAQGDSTDILVLKVDAAGETVWQKTHGGRGNDYAWSVIVNTDGNIVICGSTGSYGAVRTDAMLMCLDPQGDLLWVRTYGGDAWERMEDVTATSDGGFALAGWTSSFGASGGSQAWLIKTDASGNKEWDHMYGGGNEDDFGSICQLYDGGYVMSGSTTSMGEGYEDVYVVRVNAEGDPIWQHAFGGSGNDFGRRMVVGSKGLYVTGWAGSPGLPGYKGNYDVYVLNLDLDGNLIWDYCFGGPGYDGSEEIDATYDGGFVVAGHLQDMGSGLTGGYVFKISASGSLLWEATPGNSSEATRSVRATSDGGVITAGSVPYGTDPLDVYMVKTNASGQTAELE